MSLLARVAQMFGFREAPSPVDDAIVRLRRVGATADGITETLRPYAEAENSFDLFIADAVNARVRAQEARKMREQWKIR